MGGGLISTGMCFPFYYFISYQKIQQKKFVMLLRANIFWKRVRIFKKGTEFCNKFNFANPFFFETIWCKRKIIRS